MEEPDCPSSDQADFWSRRCGPTAKSGLLGVLLLGFLGQTFLVYADDSPSVELDEVAQEGRRVWLQHNCQACHQLYGFGGFLGPDLTNSASRLQKQQLADRLALGEGQMPKFDIPPEEVDALWAFLVAMDKSGVGQARNPALASATGGTMPAMTAASEVVAASGDSAVENGFRIYKEGACIACHVLFGTSAIGAPDLSLTSSRLSPEEIRQVLEVGIAPTMPPSGLSAEQRAQVQAFLSYLGEHREAALEALEQEKGDSFWSSLPWWEFE
ncbi:MAG: c-type cytochrome [Planctomycetota bacterium]|jgi:nitric oxide reductase subunit C